MLGIELQYNGNTISAPIGTKSIGIAVTNVRENIYINFNGLDIQTKKGVTWFKSKLQIGDCIHIAIKDIENEPSPIEVPTSYYKREYTAEEKREQTEWAIKRFNKLKMILKERGAI